MTPLHPRQLTLLRLRFALLGAMLLIPAGVADGQAAERGLLPLGTLTGIALLLLLAAVLLMPRRRYAAWGYRMDEDELSVRSGLMVRRLTVVPFGRVQHIDIKQGPIERGLGLATLVLHTAGTHNAAVKLPGLLHAEAETIRDHVRSKIRQDLL